MIRHALRATVRAFGVVATTAVEVTALSVWLGLVADASPLSIPAAVGVAALGAGLLVAGLGAHVTVKGWRREVPAPPVVALALAETALWVGWFGAVRRVGDPVGVALVGVALAVGLAPRHAIADNLLRSRRPLSTLVGRVPAGLALVEAAGATVWVLVVTGWVVVPEWVVTVPTAGFSAGAVVGGGVLAGALFVRHALAVRYALRANRDVGTAGWQSSWGTPPE
ncbi:hypothetical protein [Halorussus marinus]|uniref:hypothetical protein n=1 Tax=Halorussus marinus TaxID=2505976 RepID=UPI00106E221E|nr:hypothetical protein [Halorussus marinus]